MFLDYEKCKKIDFNPKKEKYKIKGGKNGMKETQEKLGKGREEKTMEQENFTNNKEQKEKTRKALKNELGITLIALVVTIVVLLILAGITINLLFSNGGIFKTAQDAANAWNEATINEQASLDNIVDQIDNLVNGSNTQTGPVTNPYGEDWDYAWVCNDGVWDNTQYTAGNEVEGDIVAKFYATENQIQPPELIWGGYDNPIAFPQGTEYHLVIEGTGDMGALMETSGTQITNAYGWHTLTAVYLAKYMATGTIPSDFVIMPYVTEITICDGITNIGDYSFGGDTSLRKITIGNSVSNIGSLALAWCGSLTNVTIPNGVTSIGDSAFVFCTSLANITIPSSVTSIGNYTFGGCTSLTNITYTGTKAEWNNITKDEDWSTTSSLTSITCTDGVITL